MGGLSKPGIFTLVVLLAICQLTMGQEQVNVSEDAVSISYPIQPVNIQHVKLTDGFWLPIIKRVQQKTIAYALDKCEEEGRMDNFLIAGGMLDDTIRGAMPFDDTDLYKIIEGASYSLVSAPDPRLERQLDELIGIIATGQEDDGYLTTWRTAEPDNPPAPWVRVIRGERWESLEASHELYNAGHLYEAAIAHFRATGKRNFLDIALKNADLMVKTFGPGEGQIETIPGHQIIETGLLQLYKVTGRRGYLDLAKYFLDSRGHPDHHKLFGPYSQDHVPVTEQDEVVGHAVRAVYMYAAMTDIAVLENDEAYKKAVLALWDNMVTKKMYVTGGIGARHEGESFGENYELPNLTAYSETCAAIGSIYWNHRLSLMSGDVKYFDIIERTIYNAMIAGVSLEGTEFFYPNALESDGEYGFNLGKCTRQGWFDCSCCPTNIIRFLPSMPSLVYAQSGDEVYVNMFVGSEAEISFPDGTVSIAQETEYPWKGGVLFSVSNQTTRKKTIRIRIPHWLRNVALPGELYTYVDHREPAQFLINGKEPDDIPDLEYATIQVEAGADMEFQMKFKNKARIVMTNPLVEENINKAALEYGPFVYAFESVDNPGSFDKIKIGEMDEWLPEWRPGLLKGIITLKHNGFTAVPYYAWSNRGRGKMKVWVDISR